MKGFGLYLLILVCLLAGVSYVVSQTQKTESISYSDVYSYFEQGDVDRYTLEGGTLTMHLKNENRVVSYEIGDYTSVWWSQLGSVMVNSGGLAAYRCSILAENIDTYLNESYLGRHVEFSDDSLLTLFALLHGRTVQQPSAFAFAWMPDRWSHHYRQQERWFRGSFIRGLWRIRFLPVLSWGWWRQATGWMQIWLVISVFVYLLLWRPLVLGSGVPPTVVLVPLAIGLAQGSRYISVWRSDTTGPQRYASLLLSPVATLWSALILRPLRVWGMVTSAKMGWNTRQQVEVTSQ